MDEECLRPGDPTDSTMLAKMDRTFNKHKHYISHEKADIKLQKIMARNVKIVLFIFCKNLLMFILKEFQLVHYAGDVTYSINGFLEKNNDLLFRDVKESMSKSSNGIVQMLFPPKEQKSMKRPETAITQFKTSLNNLIVILMDKEPSYIRCIKPNDVKKAGSILN